jgi:hypothetical protein
MDASAESSSKQRDETTMSDTKDPNNDPIGNNASGSGDSSNRNGCEVGSDGSTKDLLTMMASNSTKRSKKNSDSLDSDDSETEVCNLALLFVSRMVDTHRTIDTCGQFDMIPGGKVMKMMEQLLDYRDAFRKEGKPYSIDIGYHYTREENLQNILTVRKLHRMTRIPQTHIALPSRMVFSR